MYCTAGGIMLVLCAEKITFIFRKIYKNILQPELCFLAQMRTKFFVGWRL